MPYIKILRPVNILFVSVTILFGALYRNPVSFDYHIFFAVLSAGLVTAGGYVINDFFDLKIDLVNRPQRMIPSGKISPKSAYLYSVFLFAMGIAFSFFTANIICVLLAISNSLLLFLYARNLKKKLLSGNLLVAYAAGSCFVYGALAADNLSNAFNIAIFAFLFTFVREILKDAEDVEGDKQFGVNSLALQYGKKTVIRTSCFFIFLITLFYLYLYFINYFSFITLIFSTLFVIIPAILIMFYIKANIDSKKAFSKSSSIVKFEMFIVLIIALIGN